MRELTLCILYDAVKTYLKCSIHIRVVGYSQKSCYCATRLYFTKPKWWRIKLYTWSYEIISQDNHAMQEFSQATCRHTGLCQIVLRVFFLVWSYNFGYGDLLIKTPAKNSGKGHLHYFATNALKRVMHNLRRHPVLRKTLLPLPR